MQTLTLKQFPYSDNSCALFEHFADLPAAIFLDSGRLRTHPAANIDIISADPIKIIHDKSINTNDYDAYLKLFQESRDAVNRLLPVKEHYAELPFIGGAIGFLTYDSSRIAFKLTEQEQGPTPNYHVGIYNWALINDHQRRQCWLVAQPNIAQSTLSDITARLQPRPQQSGHHDDNRSPFSVSTPFESNWGYAQYCAAFKQIQNYIHAGDCYQVNLAQRFQAEFSGDPWLAYQHIRNSTAAPFSAYIRIDDEQSLLSYSPERFLKVCNNRVFTQPIKGTRKRHADSTQDQQAIQELSNSEKDRAENVMIVDLLRNDLSKCCSPSSVNVEKLFNVESFAAVHHLVSSISGTLKKNHDALDLLYHSFPGGSITGAPKKRAIEIIDELEDTPRSIYCGSVFYYSSNGNMDSSITIRSILASKSSLYCWGGGGIVADSDCDAEYQESIDKIAKLLKAASTAAT